MCLEVVWQFWVGFGVCLYFYWLVAFDFMDLFDCGCLLLSLLTCEGSWVVILGFTLDCERCLVLLLRYVACLLVSV